MLLQQTTKLVLRMASEGPLKGNINTAPELAVPEQLHICLIACKTESSSGICEYKLHFFFF